METPENPMLRRLGDYSQIVSLTGCVMLVYSDDLHPVYCDVHGLLLVPVWRTIEEADAYYPILRITRETKPQRITDGVEFLASLHEGGLAVMLNPRIVEGKTRFTLVHLPE